MAKIVTNNLCCPSIYYSYMDTPIGKILLISSYDQLIALRIEGQENFSVVPPYWHCNANMEVLMDAKQQLDAYFSGERHGFSIHYRLQGTCFQQHIWGVLAKIPYGKIITYKALAHLTAYPNAIRALASALAQNRFPIILPCHRVIRSDGSLGGYAAGLPVKQTLLNLEQGSC